MAIHQVLLLALVCHLFGSLSMVPQLRQHLLAILCQPLLETCGDLRCKRSLLSHNEWWRVVLDAAVARGLVASPSSSGSDAPSALTAAATGRGAVQPLPQSVVPSESEAAWVSASRPVASASSSSASPVSACGEQPMGDAAAAPVVDPMVSPSLGPSASEAAQSTPAPVPTESEAPEAADEDVLQENMDAPVEASAENGQEQPEELKPPAFSLSPMLQGCARIPMINPWGEHRGRLLEALAISGVAFLEIGEGSGSPVPDPCYGQWFELLGEARSARARFNTRPCIEHRLLRLSGREDLQRTLEGHSRAHSPDDRVMFGFSDSALRQKWLEWDDLRWVPEHYARLKKAAACLVESELAPLCAGESGPPTTLGARIRSGKETWSQSALRHCVYPVGGACTEHSDYGVLTLQQCDSPGLEAHVDGEWQVLPAPPGYVVAFAGDMLERLTNGHTKALMHRVCMGPAASPPSGCELRGNSPSQGQSALQRPTARQAHIIFLQPDWDTVVQPLQAFRSGTDADLKPIRYGDWHQEKVSLAFGLSRYGKPGHSHARWYRSW